jgi:biotin carboxyl carrier protein
MKLRVTIDGEAALLELQQNAQATYRLTGVFSASGESSVAEVGPGIFSVLLGRKSLTVHIASNGEEREVWVAGRRYLISVADQRDRSGRQKRQTSAGPLEVHAQMPGKVVKLLVAQGAVVEAGQGLIVVEAMKMQNEMKSPRDGTVTRIYVTEGAAVAAGEKLMVVG